MFNTCVPMQMWARMVKELGECECAICGATSNLQAHHILPRSQYPEYANDLNNGLCLCRRCHYLYHNGKYDSTGDQWQGIQRPPIKEYEAVKEFRDKCTVVLIPRGTVKRIQATGQSVNGFVVRAVLDRLRELEAAQGVQDEAQQE